LLNEKTLDVLALRLAKLRRTPNVCRIYIGLNNREEIVARRTSI